MSIREGGHAMWRDERVLVHAINTEEERASITLAPEVSGGSGSISIGSSGPRGVPLSELRPVEFQEGEWVRWPGGEGELCNVCPDDGTRACVNVRSGGEWQPADPRPRLSELEPAPAQSIREHLQRGGRV